MCDLSKLRRFVHSNILSYMPALAMHVLLLVNAHLALAHTVYVMGILVNYPNI
jgi:hypothetical protein